ncbi:type-b cytochrome [Roseomonas fluvialis]|uniref:Type-b cytochrome n=1 Tax=Roseomonas fluvialis TaxID=1750527 RepID=A0ABN6PBI6_9PROT|nr:type-b cytochrome [Roseomonas fluvialis]
MLAAFAIGLIMVALPLTQLLAKIIAYQVHKTIGLLVPPLVVWRLWLRARRGRPVDDPALPGWQRRAATAAHAALYALLIVVPVLGYLSASTAPGQIETVMFLLVPIPHILEPDEATYESLRALHQVLAWSLVLLAAGHAGMAVAHHARGHRVLTRMLGR